MTMLTLSLMLPGKSFRIAGIVALAGIVTGILTISREPTPAAPIQSAPVAKDEAFVGRWDLKAEDFPLLKRTDRLAVRDPGPIAVKTVPVLEPAEPPAPPVEAKAEIRKPKKKLVMVEHNVCTRHGMHKVTTRGGRSWRCRR